MVVGSILSMVSRHLSELCTYMPMHLGSVDSGAAELFLQSLATTLPGAGKSSLQLLFPVKQVEKPPKNNAC